MSDRLVFRLAGLAALGVVGWTLLTHRPTPRELAALDEPEPGTRPEPLNRWAQQAFERGAFSEAVRLQEQWLETTPSHASGWESLGEYLAALGRKSDADRAWTRSAELLAGAAQAQRGPNPGTWAALGRLRRKSGDFGGSLAAYDRAADEQQVLLGQRDNGPVSWYVLGKLRARAGQPLAALSAFREAERLGTAQVAPAEQARALSRLDELLDAAERAGTGSPEETELQEALQQSASLASQYRDLGWYRAAIADASGAQAAWALAAQVQERVTRRFADETSLYNLACYLALAGRTEPALDAFERAIEAGWRQRRFALEDEDLHPLHAEPRFRDALNLIRERGERSGGNRPLVP